MNRAAATRYGVLTLDPDGRVLSLDPGSEQIFGLASVEARGRKLDELLAEGIWAQLRHAVEAAGAGRSAELRGVAARGAAEGKVPVALAMRQVRVDDRLLYALIVRELPRGQARPAPDTAPGTDDLQFDAPAVEESPPQASPGSCSEGASPSIAEPVERAQVVEDEPEKAVVVADRTPAGERVRESLSDRGVRTALAGEYDESKPAPEIVIVNLADPASVQWLRDLVRSMGEAPEIVAYALPAGAPAGFWLGSIGVLLRPLSKAQVVAALGRLPKRCRRAIVVAAETETTEELQPGLAALRISAAVVLDARQASQLVPSICPDLVLAHLSPRAPDAHRALAAILRSAEAREASTILVIDAEAEPREEAYLRAGGNLLSTRGTLRSADLPEQVAALIEKRTAENTRAA